MTANPIAQRLREDWCSCDEAYKSRKLTDPHCESCSSKDERNEAADEIERLERELEHVRLVFADYIAANAKLAIDLIPTDETAAAPDGIRRMIEANLDQNLQRELREATAEKTPAALCVCGATLPMCVCPAADEQPSVTRKAVNCPTSPTGLHIWYGQENGCRYCGKHL